MAAGPHPIVGRATRNLRDDELRVFDGTAPVNQVIVALDSGDLAWESTRSQGRNAINVLDRGSLSHMRRGDEAPVRLTFTIKYVECYKQTADAICTLYEAIHRIGCAAAWLSTNPDGGDVYTVDMDFVISAPAGSSEESELIQFRIVHGDVNFTEGDEFNTLAFDGEAFMTEPDISKVSSTTTTSTTTTHA